MPTNRCANRALPLAMAGALLAAACGRDSVGPLALGPSYSTTSGAHVVSGAVTGSGGVSICSVVPAPIRVRVLAMPPSPLIVQQQTLGCPGSNAFAFSLAPGTYWLQAVLPTTAALGQLPIRHLDTVPVIIGPDQTRDIQIEDGASLGGGITFDGTAVPDVTLQLAYGLFPALAAAFMASGVSGLWFETFGRQPPRLQRGVRYRVVGTPCTALAARATIALPAGPFLFPDSVGALTCTMSSNGAEARTHDRGRLVATAGAGDFGSRTPEVLAASDGGFGVQFPIDSGPVHFPTSASHLFRGGLVVGIAPDRILTAVNVRGYWRCGGPVESACRDLGADGTLHVASPDPHGKFITWRYSDAESPEAVGLDITQRSFDGDADYVLFQFTIHNTGPGPVTFYAGNFMDWDIDQTFLDDIAGADLGGRLMFIAGQNGAGNYLGSMILGQPISGNHAWSFGATADYPTARQFTALSGGEQVLTAGPGDVRYVHGAGPITLAKGHQADLWIALVAGQNRAALLAAAAAAEADVTQRGRGPGDP